MNTKFVNNLKLLLIILDAILINGIFIFFIYFFRPDILHKTNVEFLYLFIVLNFAWITSTLVCSVYDEKYIISITSFLNCSVRSWVSSLLIFSVIIVYLFNTTLAFMSVIVFLLLIYLSLLTNRLITGYCSKFYRTQYYNSNKVLIVGYNNLSIKLAEQLQADDINKNIIGFCEEENNVFELSKYPILGNVQNAIEICEKYKATEIYSTIMPEHNINIAKLILMAELNCIRFKLVPNLAMYMNMHTEVQHLEEIPIIAQFKEPLQSLNNRISKRTFDIIFSVLVIIFINSWLILLIATLIWIESKSAAIFSQLRTGMNNIPFRILKFTSMRKNKDSNSVQAVKNDKRVTKVGKFLRRTSLDEFPQFFNVLKGDMSIVGPRPHMLKHTDEYSKIIEQYMVRQFLKPGITGWAQVNGHRGETKNIHQMQKRIEYDIWYVENWSLRLDIKVIFLTVINAVKGEKNAY